MMTPTHNKIHCWMDRRKVNHFVKGGETDMPTLMILKMAVSLTDMEQC